MGCRVRMARNHHVVISTKAGGEMEKSWDGKKDEDESSPLPKPRTSYLITSYHISHTPYPVPHTPLPHTPLPHTSYPIPFSS